MEDAQLAAALREAAYLEGDFTLRSGKKSRYYLDKYLFETNPRLLRALASRFAAFAGDAIDRIAGAELGAVALAAATALECDKPFVIVRNARKADYGTGRRVEGALRPGDRLLLVEDIATSGGQAIEAVRTLRDAGAEVLRVVVAVDRMEGAREKILATGCAFDALFTSEDLGIIPAL